MSNLTSDLNLLEDLSKQISDLIYNNQFADIPKIDAQRKLLIKKIKYSKSQNNDIKKRIENLVEKNIENVKKTELSLKTLSRNHNKFNKRLKAYSLNK